MSQVLEFKPSRVTESGGASAGVDREGGKIRLIVRDREGKLIFEHDPVSGRSVLHPEIGDLEISVPEGSMTLSARRRVRISGEEGVDIESPGDVTLDGRKVRMRAEDADLSAGNIRVMGERLVSAIGRAAMVFDTMETRAGRVYSRAREMVGKVDELMHLDVGEFWAAASEALHLRGKRTSLKAEGRVKIDGERIDLG